MKVKIVKSFAPVVWLVASSIRPVAAADANLIDIAAEVGIAQSTTAYNTAVGDYNGDGRPDFLLNRRWDKPLQLFLNQGGTFVEDTRTFFGSRDRLDCQWADPNRDGRLDFFCARGANHGTAIKANELWIQQPDGTFRDEALAWNVIDKYGRGRQVAWLNFDGDNFPDLFVGNHSPRQDSFPSPNRLFVNKPGSAPGTRTFEELVIPGLTEEFGNVCSFATDIDKDGFDDLLACGNSRLFIYRNTGGTGFVDMAAGLGLATTFHRDALAADVTGPAGPDGIPDLVLVANTSVKIYRGLGGWQFASPITYPLARANQAVATDMDGDGDLDVYVSTWNDFGTPNPPDLLLRNDGNGTLEAQTVSTASSESVGGRVAALDHDLDGKFGVLLINSNDWQETVGPLQLLVDSTTPPPPPPPVNLLANPGFETGSLSPWSNWGGGFSIAPSNAHSGSWAAQVINRGGGGQVIPATPGKTYTVSAYGRVNVSHWAAIGYRFFNSAGMTIAGGKDLAPFGTTYGQRSASFVTPPGTARLMIQLWNSPGGNLYADDFLLTSP